MENKCCEKCLDVEFTKEALTHCTNPVCKCHHPTPETKSCKLCNNGQCMDCLEKKRMKYWEDKKKEQPKPETKSWKESELCKNQKFDIIYQEMNGIKRVYVDFKQVESLISTLLSEKDNQIATAREEIDEIIKREKQTWEKESIGYKAVESVELALKELVILIIMVK